MCILDELMLIPGVAVWDNLIGSTKTDMSYCLDVNNNKIIAGGSFSEVVTFESQDGNLLTQSSMGLQIPIFANILRMEIWIGFTH